MIECEGASTLIYFVVEKLINYPLRVTINLFCYDVLFNKVQEKKIEDRSGRNIQGLQLQLIQKEPAQLRQYTNKYRYFCRFMILFA